MDKNTLSIASMKEEDRPREKMMTKGAQVLTNAELLAILIGSGNRKESAVQLSQRILITADNNLSALGKFTIKDLMRNFVGIGEAKALCIKAALELGNRRMKEKQLPREKITCSHDLYILMSPILKDLPYEELWIILTNRAGKVLRKLKVSQGGTGGTYADVQLIIKEAILSLASGLFLSHNHPSGNKTPSFQDKQLTQKIKEASKMFDIRLLDHVIVCDGDYYSFADNAVL